MSATVGEPTESAPGASILDRPLNLAAVTWETVAWVVIVVVALALRLVQLDIWALSPAEARHAYDAWLLYRGQPAPPDAAIAVTAPLFLLLQALAFFLFGATDVVARIVPAVAGAGLVVLQLVLRPAIGRPAALGVAALAAISPTLVYASRVATPPIVTGFLALALVVTVTRLGAEASARRRWALLAGILLGAMAASGAAALTVLVTMLVGAGLALLLNPESVIRAGLLALVRGPGLLLSLAAGFGVTVLVLFTRFFAAPLAIAGLGETLAAWGGSLFQGPAEVPVQFFLLAILLYEPLAVLMTLVAALGLTMPGVRRFGGAFLGGWFVAALLIWSFSAGRDSGDALFVALPLVLLGGAALGEALARVAWPDLRGGPGGLLALVLLGLILAIIAVGILLSAPPPGLVGFEAALPAVVIAMLVVVPLAYVAWLLTRTEVASGRAGQPALVLLVVVAVLLAGFTLRSAVMLTLVRGATGTELLAQRTSSGAVLPAVQRLERLARDATVNETSARDVTGGHGLAIAAEPAAQWPFRWYFREFPEFTTTPTAANAGADVVISRDQGAVEAAGYRPLSVPWLSQVPPAYQNLDAGAVLRDLVLPTRWLEASRFLLYRDGIPEPGNEPVTIGLSSELAARVLPTTGPYSLADRPGPGAGEGQFSQPLGVAVAPDGTIYVVDQGNARIQLFDADGDFLAIWDGADGGVPLARTPNGLGPTGISVDADGRVYVADTWNHRVVVLDAGGALLLELGAPADAAGARLAADTGDDPGRVTTMTGAFFGPRDVVVYNDEIYVVDTGNERIQVFGPDGAFRRVWGGYGSGPGQLIEPVGIAVDDQGIIYVADSGNARISLFTPAGEPVAQWPVPAWPDPDPAGMRPAFQPYLAFGANGNLYATSADTGSVEVLDPSGQVVESLTSAGGAQLQRPTGIAATPAGDILITDLAANAVLRYTPPLLSPITDIQLLPNAVDATPAEIEASPVAEGSPTIDARGADGQRDGAVPSSRGMPPPPGLDPDR